MKLADDLSAIVGPDRVSTKPADLESHSHDESTHEPVTPAVVVFPKATEDVSGILALANRRRIPVTGYGAGTSVEGQAIPAPGGIVVDFSQMNRIVAVHEADFQATVEAGVLRNDLEHHLGMRGLFFPPDPGANASIGGMIANNASGIRTLKYGSTRDNVLALTAVLADGRVIRAGSRSVKQSAGYDLRNLIVGSEGTLALVTTAVLRLQPIPEHHSTAVVSFESIEAAARVVAAIMAQGLAPAALELLNVPHVEWMNEDENTALPAAPALMIEFSGSSGVVVRDEMEAALELARTGGAVHVSSADGPGERTRLWRMRHHARERYVRRNPGRRIMSIDVSVPISALPDLVAFAEAKGKAAGFELPILSHAGDGNVHIAVIHDPGLVDTAAQLTDAIVHHALEVGGTSSGEHGIGVGKRQYLAAEFGSNAVQLMREIKATLDPNNILNPGKVLPTDR